MDIEVSMDCVLNRCLIPKFTNLKASNKSPSDYLGELSKQNLALEDALAKHLIPSPADLIKGDFNDVYELFLDYRGEAIMAILKKHVFDERDKLLKSNA